MKQQALEEAAAAAANAKQVQGYPSMASSAHQILLASRPINDHPPLRMPQPSFCREAVRTQGLQDVEAMAGEGRKLTGAGIVESVTFFGMLQRCQTYCAKCRGQDPFQTSISTPPPAAKGCNAPNSFTISYCRPGSARDAIWPGKNNDRVALSAASFI
ncbi:hypothetical protein CVT26_012860 [Gymnopilus dilepis]|uniref:Uncharacterized protein n=1 Tax=Gymnopilus dilepis TaxID=231916 RepID=A0A409WVK4_9AGAR|nr:hypothetical protein CVT26_012860 [Gymnopilus dilepis]